MTEGIAAFYFPIDASLGYPQGFPIYRNRPNLVETVDRSDSFWIKSLTFRLFDFQPHKKTQFHKLFEQTFEVLGLKPNHAPEHLFSQLVKYPSRSCLIEVAVEVDPVEKIQEDLANVVERGSSSAMTSLFNEALAGVRVVLQAHTAATGQLLSIPTVQSLPPLVPCALSKDLNSLNAGEADLGIYALPQAVEEASDQPLRRDTLATDQMTSFLLAFDCNGPFVPYVDLEQEALHSLQVTGQYRAGIIALASAFELLFDDLLLLLVWETGYEPKQAISDYFKRDGSSGEEPNSITQRVTKHLAWLLGDKWLKEGDQIVSQWREKIADMRNLVAHNGELPNEADVQVAIRVRNQLRTHVANCLFARRKEYPLTAELFLGVTGFTKRGEKWDPTYNVNDSLENQARFGRYRAEVKNGILPKSKRRKPSKENSDLVCFYKENGLIEYFLVDPEARKMARITSISKFPKAIREEIEDATEAARRHISSSNTTVNLNIHPSRIPIKKPNWEPAWTTLPLFEIFPLPR